jgi:anti-sigma regulatory factor (Ser/Thr protein kinase)
LIAARFSDREFSIPADLARLPEVRRWADEAAGDFGFGEPERYQIKMAASEAVANAVEHGSSSPADQIGLRVRNEGGALAFYVTDTGRFVPRIAPRGSMPERGRGLAFMGQLMDDVDLRPGPEGTVIRFAKRLGSS